MSKKDLTDHRLSKNNLHENGLATFGKGSKISKIYLENIESFNFNFHDETTSSTQNSISKTNSSKSTKKLSIGKSILNFFKKRK